MSKYDYDLFVIGAGSGGVRASRMAAGFGAKVAVAECSDLGGTCVNLGCVPKKLFVYASEYSESFKDANGFGWNSTLPDFNWETLRNNKDTEIKRLNGIYGNMLENTGVEIIKGRAKFVDQNTVEVNGKKYTAERILICTGAWPNRPEFEGSEHMITSNEVFHLKRLPKKAVDLGGGYIAVEFAGIFAGLGIETTQLYRSELFLRGFDKDVREFVSSEMRKKEIDLRFQVNITKITKNADESYTCHLTDGTSIETDLILCATGRTPNLQGLGMENVDVKKRDNGEIIVDDTYQTSVPSIYAVGDVTGTLQLTPVALAEGMALAKNLYNGENIKVDYDNIPTAVFCRPNIGTVGPTEERAREIYGEVTIYKSDFRAMKNTISGSEERTFMKLIVDTKTDKVVAVHIVGADAGEMTQGLAVAIKAGATKEVFDSTIGIHPTAAEEFVTMRTPAK